jgi:cytochrome P450
MAVPEATRPAALVRRWAATARDRSGLASQIGGDFARRNPFAVPPGAADKDVGTPMPELTINLADPNLYAVTDGLDTMRHLQRVSPIYWNDVPGSSGFWALTRYADAVSVYRNPRSFTTRHGIQVGQAGRGGQPGAGKMLVLSDRDDHRRIKSVVSKHMTPAALQRLLPCLRAATHDAVTLHSDGTPFDFMTGVAAGLTLAVLGGLLGIPAADQPMVAGWTSVAFGSTLGESTQPLSDLDILEANTNLFAYFAVRLAERRQHPADDLLSALVSPTDPGDQLTDEEILFNVHLLLAGGHETTRQALAGVAIAFHDHPAQWDRVRADTALIPTAVEEVLRWSAPSLNVMRTATTDIDIGGQLIHAGEQVTMWNPILNRDEAAFPRPDTFDVGRDPNRHLSFGMGSHTCLGSWTARHELHVLIEELTAHVRRIEITGPVRRTRSNRTWGYDHLPMRFLR